MDIRKFAGAGALMLAIAACGRGDEDALMGRGANALTPEQVDAALGPDVANESGEPGNASEAQALEDSEAAEAAAVAEPVPSARQERAAPPEPDEEEEEATGETGALVDNNSSE